MSSRPLIEVVTTTRADYGLLRWLIRDLQSSPHFRCNLIVSGSHLVPEFGDTWREIEADGLAIEEKIPVFGSDFSERGMAETVSRSIVRFSERFGRVKPDLVVVLGDRFEMMAVAEAAFLNRIPIAHIHGGEVTRGALDDTMRHVVSKLSSLHFVAAEDYKRRVIQLGEDPNSVHVVGALSLDGIDVLDKASLHELSDITALKLESGFALCTIHPETTSSLGIAKFVKPLFDSLSGLPELQVVFTSANADPGGDEINSLIEHFVLTHSARMALVKSLGHTAYLSAVAHAGLVIGNSSSGIVEAPAIGTPTVNIGDRQLGRLRAPSVIDVRNDTEGISDAIQRALSREFRELARRKSSAYGQPGAASRIIRVLANTDFEALLPKGFHDLKIDK